MSRLSVSGSWPLLAASLLLGGCYIGLDLDDGEASSGATANTGSATVAMTTGDPDPGETAAGATDGASDGASDGATTEAVDGSTSDDAGTSGPATTEPDTTASGTTEAMSTSGADDTTGAADTGLPPPVDVPDNAYCVAVGDWDPAWAQLELDVLEIVNQVRATGADCHSKGMFGATSPLTMNPALRCAARKHSADMAARNFFDHTNPDNESPWDRMGKAGYGGYSNAGENIAAGSPDAQGTMNQWMDSDGHCANIMNPGFKEIGVGYSTGGQYGHLWTQVFGAK